jgi:XTP/dITP diphosphohydrolase
MARFVGKDLVLATHNAGKVIELRGLFEPLGIRLISAGELGLPEPAETESTFVGNARIKAHSAAKGSGLPALADDSGITIDGLGGAPGVYTADWAETPQGRNFDIAMERCWRELETVGAPFPRFAQFRCTLVLAQPDGSDQVFEGVAPGQVVWPGRGSLGHGFDPIFQPDGYAVTFGEMDRFEKNRLSHRGRAFELLIKECFT